MKRIFQDYAAGASPWRIAVSLNNEGLPGPGGGIWYDATIPGRPLRGDGLLRNQTYIGRLVWSRQYNVKDPMTGLTIRRYSEPGAVVVQEVPHLRIVDQNLWDQVEKRLTAEAAPSRGSGRNGNDGFWNRRRPRHLLSGKAYCRGCGRVAAIFGQDYLGCRTAKHGACRNMTTIRCSVLEERVLAALGQQLMRPESRGRIHRGIQRRVAAAGGGDQGSGRDRQARAVCNRAKDRQSGRCRRRRQDKRQHHRQDQRVGGTPCRHPGRTR